MRKYYICPCMSFSRIFTLASAQVYSENIVGYETLETKGAGMTLLGANFQKVGGGAISVQDAFQGTFVGGTLPSEADQLMVWSVANGYTYYFFGDWSDGQDWSKKWYLNGDDSAPTADTIPAGAGVWLVRRGVADDVVAAGEVSMAASKTFTIKASGMTLLAGAYPVDLALNGGTLVVENPVGGTLPSEADQLMVWSVANGYTYYFFGDWNDGQTWSKKWYLNGDDSAPTPDSIPAGSAVWYVNLSAQKTLTISSPL